MALLCDCQEVAWSLSTLGPQPDAPSSGWSGLGPARSLWARQGSGALGCERTAEPPVSLSSLALPQGLLCLWSIAVAPGASARGQRF